MYLLLGALAAFAEFHVRSAIMVPGNVAETAHNIMASEPLFRLGLASDLFGGACNAILAVALYTLLNRGSTAPALYSMVVTGSLLSIIPLIVLFLALQRYWRTDIASGAVKQ